jgi:hypothetical protein
MSSKKTSLKNGKETGARISYEKGSRLLLIHKNGMEQVWANKFSIKKR